MNAKESIHPLGNCYTDDDFTLCLSGLIELVRALLDSFPRLNSGASSEAYAPLFK